MNFTKKICVHTFLTSGFLGWGELFLEGLRYAHGEQIHVRIDSRDLSDRDIDLLYKTYGNLEIHNRPFAWDTLSNETEVSIDTIHGWRKEIEQGIVTKENYLFKIAVSVNERYRSLQQVAHEVHSQGFDLMLHSDADVYIRSSMMPLFNIMQQHDFCLYIRPNRPHRLAVVGGFLGFNLNEKTDRFLQIWMNKIDETPFTERWIGYGQSVLWFALNESEFLEIADLNKVSGAPKLSKLFEQDKELWLGNSKVIGPSKYVSIQKCWEDLLSKYPRVPLPKRKYSERIYSFVSAKVNSLKQSIKR
jgi:hypothetical protein